jgi:DNA repair protein RadC
VEAFAGRLLREVGSLAELARADPHDLIRCRGVGRAQAARIAGIFALSRRLARASPAGRCRFASARDVHALVGPELRGFPQERFLVLCLDARHGLLRLQPVSLGTARAALVHPRDVFAPAVRAGAVGVVVVHNHPSGDPRPSPEDLALTERLRQAGELLGIEVLDHVIVGEGNFVSLAEDPRRTQHG